MKKPSNLRREAMLEAIGWLEYRVAVCRQEEERYPETSRARATERSARHELELAIREIAKIATTPKRSKALRDAAAERERFIASCKAATPSSTSQGQGDRR